MATVYFTTNADSGDGSLRSVIASATAGDVIMPDPDVFDGQTEITIYFESYITLNKNLTLDGGDFTVKCDGTNYANSWGTVAFFIRANASFNKFYFLNWTTNRGAVHVDTNNLTVSITNCSFESCVATENASCIGIWNQTGNTIYVDNCSFLTGMSAYICGCIGARHGNALNTFYISNCDFGSNYITMRSERNWDVENDYGFYLDNVITTGQFDVMPTVHIVGKVECSYLGVYNETARAIQFAGGTLAVKSIVKRSAAGGTYPSWTQYIKPTGSGYIALPSDCDDYDFAEGSSANVKRCNYGAGITALTSTQDTDAHTATATVTATDATKDFILEHKVTGVWTRLTAATTYTEEMSPNEVMAVRTWDGDSWKETYQYYQSGTTRYFYTNADSGDGSLRATITAASTGDVIEPSPDVFASGTTIIIPLSSTIAFNDAKTLTIQGNGRRIRLDGQVTVDCAEFGTSSTNAIIFNDVDFVNGNRGTIGGGIFVYNNNSPSITLNRCFFANCMRYNSGSEVSGAIIGVFGTTASLTINDSVLITRKDLAIATNSNIAINRSTIIGRLVVYTITGSYYTLVDCVQMNIAASTIATTFVNAPTTSPIEFSDDWDFRLLSTSAYKTGATTTGTDFYGRTRLAGGCLGAVANIRRLTTTAGTIDVWANDTPYIDSDDVVIGTLNLAAPLSVDKSFKVGTLYLTSTLNFPSSACDRYVSVTTEASFTGATATGYGYLAVPHGTTVTGLTAGANVVVCDYGAGVTAFSAQYASNSNTLSIERTDATVSVCFEKENDDDEWDLLVAQLSSATYTDSSGLQSERYRVFDGETFITAVALAQGDLMHAFVSFQSTNLAITVVNSTLNTALAVTEKYLLMSDSYRAGETPICFARIINSETETPLTQSTISTITFTIYKYSYASIRSSGSSKTAISGWTNLTVDKTTAIKDTPVSDDPRCSFAYNFIFEPNTLTNSPFSSSGNYSIEFTVTPTTGNKVPVIFEFALV